MAVKRYKNNLPAKAQKRDIRYLTIDQQNALTKEFMDYYDLSTGKRRKYRGRYWLVYIMLKAAGARLGEVLAINDATDIDFRNAEVKLVTLKQKTQTFRIVPIPIQVISETTRYLAEFPEQKGIVFKLQARHFRALFQKLALKAGLPKDVSHPHILRHTKAIDLLRAGVPVTIVQDILGHAYLDTTAIYLRFSAQEAKAILKEKGLI